MSVDWPATATAIAAVIAALTSAYNIIRSNRTATAVAAINHAVNGHPGESIQANVRDIQAEQKSVAVDLSRQVPLAESVRSLTFQNAEMLEQVDGMVVSVDELTAAVKQVLGRLG